MGSRVVYEILMVQKIILFLAFSGQEDDEYNKEDYEYNEHLDHEPSVWGDRLEILENLPMSCLHVQGRVLYVVVDPER